MSDWLDPDRIAHPWEEITDRDKYDEQGMPKIDPELERLLAEEEEIEQRTAVQKANDFQNLRNSLQIAESNIKRLTHELAQAEEVRDSYIREARTVQQELDQLKVDLVFLASRVEDLPLIFLRYILRGIGHS